MTSRAVRFALAMRRRHSGAAAAGRDGASRCSGEPPRSGGYCGGYCMIATEARRAAGLRCAAGARASGGCLPH